MDIVLVTPGFAPLSGASDDTAEVVAGLAKALRGREHRVTVVSPLYRSIDPTAKALARRLTGLRVDVPGIDGPVEVHLYDGRTPAGVELVFLGNDAWFGQTDDLTAGEDDAERARRAGLFGRAAAAAVRSREDVAAEVVHGHGWPGALALVAGADAGLQATFLLTLHDLDGLGSFPAELAPALGIDATDQGQAPGRVFAALAGARVAAHTTVGSPAQARRLRGMADGDDWPKDPATRALLATVADLGDRVGGVPGGVDAARWNAATDAHLDHRYDPMDLSGKRRNKAAIQHDLGLPIRDDLPLVALFASPEPARGARTALEVLPEVLRNDVQVVAAFTGAPTPGGIDAAPGDAREADALAGAYEELSGLWSERFQVRRAADDALIHRLLGAADLLFIPHRRDAHGALARTAQRYGVLPVAAAVGGLEDAIVDCDPPLRTGTGFVADEATPDALLAALRRALASYADSDAFAALQTRVMRVDHTWDRSAYLFERLYEQG
ncbi:MAG TPA: glycogen/starch synthase [Polyangiaceae bacterium LLY-WYZ-14_1]|nr:glycogen/starch synthase [Polyangiaceae bacterium LLY-WYZ-14_1]